MSTRSSHPWWLVVAAVPLLVSSSHAGFFRIEDFEDLTLGPVGGQDGWIAPGESSTVAPDPADGSNQVLSVTTESTYLYRNLVVPAGATRMLFLRFRCESQLSLSFGLSDVSSPSRFDHFEAELSLTNAASELRINDDGTYRVIDVLQPGVWYCCWMLVDNLSDVTAVWLHARSGEPATGEDQLDAEGTTLFAFRNGAAGDLVNFYIKTGGGSGVDGPLLLDDLYLETTGALNLACPLTSPTAVTGLAPPEGHALARPAPNPFRDSAGIAFTLPEGEHILLTVHDLSGRTVAVLADGFRGAGTFATSWSGIDESGNRVAPGIYFVRLRATDFHDARKLVFVR